MSEIVIKGEVHSSRADFQEARNLLAEGIDTLVIEGDKDETETSWLHSWFGVAVIIFEYLFASFLYTDHQTLVDIAKGQGADVVYTRETDADLLKNSHKLVVGTAFILFYLFILLSAIFGLAGLRIAGAGTLILSGLLPIFILRLYETRKSGSNRDKKIAEQIEKAAEDGGRIVAVLGDSHAKKVPDHLPDEVEPEVCEPEYGIFSLQMGRDLFMPAIRMVGMMAVVYPVFLAILELYIALI